MKSSNSKGLPQYLKTHSSKNHRFIRATVSAPSSQIFEKARCTEKDRSRQNALIKGKTLFLVPSTKTGRLRSIATCSFKSATAFLPLSSTMSSRWAAMYWITTTRKEAHKVVFSTCMVSAVAVANSCWLCGKYLDTFCFKLRAKFDLCFLRSLLVRSFLL